MRLLLVSVLVLACSIASTECLAWGASVGPTDRYALYADFDNKVTGDPIDTRGGVFGEPTELGSLDTEIVWVDQTNRALRVSSALTNFTRPLIWQLLGNAEINQGEVRITFDITPSALDNYSIKIRENNGSSRLFLTFALTNTGHFTASDANGTIPMAAYAYTANSVLSIELVFDMTALTSSIHVNGVAMSTDRAFKVSDRGIGRLMIGYDKYSSSSPFDLDNIRVTGPLPFPTVLQADFENKTTGAPIGRGGAEANEPYGLGSYLDAIVVEPVAGNKVLDLSTTYTSVGQAARWQFLKNMEIRSGVIVLDFDIQLSSLNHYAIGVYEPLHLEKSFVNLQFESDGSMRVHDANGYHPTLAVSYNAGQLYHYRFLFSASTSTYTIFRDGTPILREQNNGITTRGIGAVIYRAYSATVGSAHMQLDNLRVFASDAEKIPAGLEFLEKNRSAIANEPVTPAVEVGVVNAFGEAVPDGTPVTLEIDWPSGPPGATLSGAGATTISGIATFSNLKFNMPGSYGLAAHSLDASSLDAANFRSLRVSVTLGDYIFADGFEDEIKHE